MRTTVTIDDGLWESAKRFSGLDGGAELIRHVFSKYVEREAARSLIALGGSDPGATAPPRRRPPRFINPQ